MSLRLSILVCTINDRIKDVPALLLPERDDVEYVVSFQYTASFFLEMIPPILKERKDVKLFPLLSTGLSANRNNALRHCATELAIIADDDAKYTTEQISQVIQCFEEHPEVDIACFQAYDIDGQPLKEYPSHRFDYAHRPKGYYFSSVEIALRVDAPLSAFDIRFGLGASYLSCGEEELFLHQSYRLGCRITYFPKSICSIPSGETTGSRFASDTKVRRSKGALLYMMFGFIGSLLRITKYALLLPSAQSHWQVWRDMFDGIMYIFNNPLNEGAGNDIPLDFQPIDTWKLPS